MPSRKKADATDREHIRETLVVCIDPLQPSAHRSRLVNIVTGKIAPKTVNADDALKIGMTQMRKYKEGWPESFHKPIAK
jgi:hypothetical protein